MDRVRIRIRIRIRILQMEYAYGGPYNKQPVKIKNKSQPYSRTCTELFDKATTNLKLMLTP